MKRLRSPFIVSFFGAILSKNKMSIVMELCPFGTYNSDIGKDKCSLCNENNLCLTGSLKPFEKTNYEISKTNKFYLQEENNPDFISLEFNYFKGDDKTYQAQTRHQVLVYDRGV